MELDTPITELPLSHRAKAVLEAIGATTVEDVLSTSLREISRMPNCGKMTAQEIEQMFFSGAQENT